MYHVIFYTVHLILSFHLTVLPNLFSSSNLRFISSFVIFFFIICVRFLCIYIIFIVSFAVVLPSVHLICVISLFSILFISFTVYLWLCDIFFYHFNSIFYASISSFLFVFQFCSSFSSFLLQFVHLNCVSI